MELQYGKSSTYTHPLLDNERLNELTKKTKRSNLQTQWLFQLVDGDFEKLQDLENKLEDGMYFYCPGDKEVVEKVLRGDK
jgi:hypothetical protein